MNMKAHDDAGLCHSVVMKGQLLLAAALLGAGMASAPVALAQSATTVYRCDGPDGTPLYQNAPGKGCRQLDLPPINSVPAAKLPVGSGSGGKSARVSDSQQRGRDSDRRRILEKELAKEQSRLDALKQEYNDGSPERLGDERNYQKYLDRVDRLKDEVAQAAQNVSSIRREIDSLP
jgi:hypothetical protein